MPGAILTRDVNLNEMFSGESQFSGGSFIYKPVHSHIPLEPEMIKLRRHKGRGGEVFL